MTTANGFAFQHNFSTTKGIDKMFVAQNNSSRRVTATASCESGGHGARTRNRFPGTTFPVSPLAIRLPSKFNAPSPIVSPACYHSAIGGKSARGSILADGGAVAKSADLTGNVRRSSSFASHATSEGTA